MLPSKSCDKAQIKAEKVSVYIVCIVSVYIGLVSVYTGLSFERTFWLTQYTHVYVVTCLKVTLELCRRQWVDSSHSMTIHPSPIWGNSTLTRLGLLPALSP